MQDVVEAVSQSSRQQDDNEGGGIEKEEVWIREYGLAKAEIRVPVGQMTASNHIVNESCSRIGVAEGIAIKNIWPVKSTRQNRRIKMLARTARGTRSARESERVLFPADARTG